jgi:xylulokinase
MAGTRGRCTLGLDVGTGSAKAVVLDPGRGVVGRASAAYPVATPRPGWAEQDPSAWWDGAVAAIRGAVADAGLPANAIEALAVSGQGAALVLLDGSGRPVRDALIHLDQRAAEQARTLDAGAFGAEVRRASGNVVAAWNVSAKAAWLREHEPAALAAARTLTSAAGFVLQRLTGRAVQSVSDAGISDLFDLGRRDWSPDLPEALGLAAGLLPSVAPATACVGRLGAEAADATGLSPAVRVLAGGEDTSSAALAAGVVAAGDAYLSLGTAGVVGVVVEGGATDEPRLLSFPHVREELDLLSGSMSAAGAALDWWSGVTGRDPAALLEEAQASPPAPEREVAFLPYLAGELHPVNDPAARGLFCGLSLASTRAELTRALVEGSAAAVAHNLEVAAAAGAPAQLLRATGGPARSQLWMQAVADATGLPVEVVDGAGDGAAVGDALIAAAGDDAELAAIAQAACTVVRRHEPDPAELPRARARRTTTARLYAASRRDA